MAQKAWVYNQLCLLGLDVLWPNEAIVLCEVSEVILMHNSTKLSKLNRQFGLFLIVISFEKNLIEQIQLSLVHTSTKESKAA